MTILSKHRRALLDAGKYEELRATLPKRKARTSPPKKVLHSVRRKKRSPKEFVRIYGSVARVQWIESLPCVACGVVGLSVNAHVGTEGKGTGRKANADQIAPLCCSTMNGKGCHEQFDDHDAPFDTDVSRAVILTHMVITAQRWRAECARRGIE